VRDPLLAGVEWSTLSAVTITGGVFSVEAMASTTGPTPAKGSTAR
jgi:hypothetical protein